MAFELPIQELVLICETWGLQGNNVKERMK